MNILILLTERFPIGMAPTNRIISICEGLSEIGNNVKVVIPIRTETSKNIQNKKPKGFIKGFKYEYMSNSTIKNKFYLIRIIQQLICYFNLFLYILKKRKTYDLIYIYGGSHIFWWPILIAIKLNKIKVINEMTEIPYYYPSKKFQILRELFFNIVFPLYDGSIVISSALFDVAAKYKPTSSIIKIPILINPIPEEKIKAPFENSIYILHTGTLTENKDGILGIIEAFSMAIKKLECSVRLVITGNLDHSPQKNDIIGLIRKYNLQNAVEFTGYISNERIMDLQSNCSLVIINKYDTFQNKYCFSTKLAEYLNYARTVISTNIGESANYLINDKNAYIVEAGNPQLIADKIIEALKNREKSIKIGNEGRKLVLKEFNYLHQSARIETFFKKICNGI